MYVCMLTCVLSTETGRTVMVALRRNSSAVAARLKSVNFFVVTPWISDAARVENNEEWHAPLLGIPEGVVVRQG